ncbi:MAG: dihydrofolate reductase [Pseudomonadota bacterium]
MDLEIDGDTFFPDYEKDAKWNTVALERYDADEKNAYDYQFVTLERVE